MKGIIFILSILFIVVMMIPITGLIIAPSDIDWLEQPRYELGGHSLYDLFESDERVRATRKNLFDKSKITLNKGVSTATGLLFSAVTYDATDYIAIKSSSAYTFSHLKYGAWYDIDKEYISSVDSISPSNARFIRYTITNTNIDTFQIEEGTATAYESYKDNDMVLAETLAYTGWDWIHFTGLEYFGLEYMDYDDLNDFYRLYISYKDY